MIARHVPALSEAIARGSSLGDGAQLRSLLQTVGLCNVETSTEIRRFALSSFDDYFDPIERGGGSTGQRFLTLPEATRRAVREEVRRSLGSPEGPFEMEVEIRFAWGVR